MNPLEFIVLGPEDANVIMAGAALFDHEPREEWAKQFLARDGHHMVWARLGGDDAGFISGVEITHPDKGTEMLLYELGVEAQFRRRGIATALVEELAAIARERGCHGMWVPVDADNEVAQQFYLAAGAGPVEPAVTMWWDLTTGSQPEPQS